jgi:hypothetical protein
VSNIADQEDVRFFFQHPDRRVHIRTPRMASEVIIDQQRAASYVGEMEREFRTLGPHNRDRRRIILWRVPADNPFYDPQRPIILKLPLLAFADETIEDRDDILLPIVHEIMMDAVGQK